MRDTGYPKVQRVDCVSGDAIGVAVAANTAGSSSLTYSVVERQYNYVWQTERAWAGTCRNLILGLDDATEPATAFSTRRSPSTSRRSRRRAASTQDRSSTG